MYVAKSLLGQIKQDLRSMGLPDTLFEADFWEKEAEHRRRHAELLSRIDEAEAKGELDDMPPLWKEEREHFKAQRASGQVPFFLASVGDTASFARPLTIAYVQWNHMRTGKQAARFKVQNKKRPKKPKKD